MKNQFVTLVIGAAAVFGFGLGLALSGDSFVLEALNTPVGSFVFKGNLPVPGIWNLPSVHDNEQEDWLQSIA